MMRKIISAKEVMFSSAFVCLFVSNTTQKLLNQFSQKSVEMWHMGRGKKRLDFGGNLDHVTSGLRLGL